LTGSVTDPDGREHLRSVPLSAARGTPDERPTLEALYRDHADFVWRTVRRLGVPDEAAEDVVQEVFIVVRRRLPDYEGRGAATTWLFAIARGVTANWRRSRQRAERRLRVVPEPEPVAPDPEDAVRQARVKSLIRGMLDELEPKQRIVFELSDIEGMSGPEVADALGVPLNTVYSRLRLARRRFKKYVQEHAAALRPGEGTR